MSEFLKNTEDKQLALKQIIKDLHDGKPFDDIKNRFHKIIKNVTPEEISEMENALIQEGLPAEEVMRLCNVHVEVFQDSLSRQKKASTLPGHPVHTFIKENSEAKKIIKQYNRALKKILKPKAGDREHGDFLKVFKTLRQIEKHYSRKENQLFPFLERKNFSGPSKVMWGKHDEIRNYFKEIEAAFNANDMKTVRDKSKSLVSEIKGMFFKEEKILFPMAIKKLTNLEWAEIRSGEKEIGYAWIQPGNLWDTNVAKQVENLKKEKPADSGQNFLQLEWGQVTPEQVNLLLKHLPVDITFVDENDAVRYYSATDDRIFPRSPGIIGRSVKNCHPAKSVHVVEKIIDSFRKKTQKTADFWINMEGRLIYIRYFPVYNENGSYKGVIEVSQDVTEIKKLEGERRLLDW
ncbi:MAG: DUF438 domain-containing protein [Spirochaetales bacterium]|nr:DUF438 domain-containing protein [Spirochaetales bacterium]